MPSSAVHHAGNVLETDSQILQHVAGGPVLVDNEGTAEVWQGPGQVDAFLRAAVQGVVGLIGAEAAQRLISVLIQKGADRPIELAVVLHNQQFEHGWASNKCFRLGE